MKSKSPRHRRHPRRGFTLIEVLATIVVMAIVLPVAMEGVSLCLSTSNLARQRGEAAGLAEAKLNELVATGQWEYPGAGDFGDDWPDYQWASTTSAWTYDSTLAEVSVRVFWPGRGEERDVIVTTLVYQGQSTQ